MKRSRKTNQAKDGSNSSEGQAAATAAAELGDASAHVEKDRLGRFIRLAKEPAVAPIKRKLQLDDSGWAALLHRFAVIPLDFRRFAAQWSMVERRRNKIVKAARDCADVILSNDISHYWESALLLDEVGAAPWADVFVPLIRLDDVREDDREWVAGAINHIGTKRAFSEITALLLRFAETLEGSAAERDESVADELPTYVSRKNSLREFTKRRVFKLLWERWPPRLRNAPNKEAATIVNCLLGLSGQEQVTANDISQMNKRTRRRYFRE